MVVNVVADMTEFNAHLKQAGDKAVLVDFFATWCGPCRQIAPKLEEMSNTITSVVFLKVDVDEATDVAEAHGISAMPTFFMFKNGAKVDELVGASQDKLVAMITKFA